MPGSAFVANSPVSVVVNSYEPEAVFPTSPGAGFKVTVTPAWIAVPTFKTPVTFGVSSVMLQVTAVAVSTPITQSFTVVTTVVIPSEIVAEIL